MSLTKGPKSSTTKGKLFFPAIKNLLATCSDDASNLSWKQTLQILFRKQTKPGNKQHQNPSLDFIYRYFSPFIKHFMKFLSATFITHFLFCSENLGMSAFLISTLLYILKILENHWKFVAMEIGREAFFPWLIYILGFPFHPSPFHPQNTHAHKRWRFKRVNYGCDWSGGDAF